jgi:DNA repair protein RecO (recombination protein O)
MGLSPMARGGRVDDARAFILHSYPYSESSLIVDAFTRSHGRLPLLARGARRPRSPQRGVLLGFQPVMLGWSGRGEVRTLIRAEWMGGVPRLNGEAMLCGFYLNELVMNMLAREDAHEQLFDDYAQAIERLALQEAPEPVLRWFEKRLLAEAGYALVLDREGDSGRSIDPGASYTYDPERGPISVNGHVSPGRRDASRADDALVVSGAGLLALAADRYDDVTNLAEAKLVMRTLIQYRLEHRRIRSREMLKELQRL